MLATTPMVSAVRMSPRVALVALVGIVGVGGQLHDSFAMLADTSWLNLHALFGVLLCTAVCLPLCNGLRPSQHVFSVDLARYIRGSTRLVYAILYGLMGIKEILALAIFLWHGGGRTTEGSAKMAPVETFQVYCVYGVLALVVVRAMAALVRHRARIASP